MKTPVRSLLAERVKLDSELLVVKTNAIGVYIPLCGRGLGSIPSAQAYGN